MNDVRPVFVLVPFLILSGRAAGSEPPLAASPSEAPEATASSVKVELVAPPAPRSGLQESKPAREKLAIKVTATPVRGRFKTLAVRQPEAVPAQPPSPRVP